MSISVTTDIHCDQCGNWISGTTSLVVEVRRSEKIAKRSGWATAVLQGKKKHFCPECTKRTRQERA